MNRRCDVCNLEHGYDIPCDRVTRNKLFSNDKKNFHTNKEAWDKYSKLENKKVLDKYAVERVEKLAEPRDGIIGISYHVQDSVPFRGLKKANCK